MPGSRWSPRGAGAVGVLEGGALWTSESSRGMGRLEGEFASVTKRGPAWVGQAKSISFPAGFSLSRRLY